MKKIVSILMVALISMTVVKADVPPPYPDSRPENTQVSLDDQLEQVNRQIDELTQALDSYNTRIMNKEAESEKYMKYEWDKYTQVMEDMEKLKSELKFRQKQMDELVKQRDKLQEKIKKRGTN